MLRKIVIDTNNTNYNPQKYPWNEELWNIVVPNIKYLEELDGLQPANEIDWVDTKGYFETSNGHCIMHRSGGYVAAYEYEYLWFEEAFLEKICDFTYNNQPLSYLLAEIAIKHNINWSYVEEYKKETEIIEEQKQASFMNIISIFNKNKLINTPLLSLKKLQEKENDKKL